MWYIGIVLRIKRKIYKKINYFIFNPPRKIYKLFCNEIKLLYKRIFVNIIILLKLILRIIMFFIFKIKLLNYILINFNSLLMLIRYRFYFFKKFNKLSFKKFDGFTYYTS